MNEKQLLAVRCALADLVGAYQNRMTPFDHDWKCHLLTIDELAEAFDLTSEVPENLEEPGDEDGEAVEDLTL